MDRCNQRLRRSNGGTGVQQGNSGPTGRLNGHTQTPNRATPRNLVALAKRIEVLTRVPAARTLGLMDDGPEDDGTPAAGDRGSAGLPRLDSNQQPSD